MDISRIRKPRCYLLYALAPSDISPNESNATINNICADVALPLAIYHDHFIGQAGGIVLFFAETATERDALQNQLGTYLEGWDYALHPLIYSRHPAAFDEQIAYTLRAYQGEDWEKLQREQRPSYGDPRQEAETAQES